MYRDHIWTPDPNQDNTPVDLKPFLKNSIFHKVASVLYRGIFQPISDLLERMSAKRTAKMVERALRNIK